MQKSTNNIGENKTSIKSIGTFNPCGYLSNYIHVHV